MSEKGLKSHHLGHKKKFHSPIGGKRAQKAAILPKYGVNFKEPNKLSMKTKHGSRASKLKFQMGGDSTDPLNLNSLIDRDPSEVTPQCSPLVDRMKDLSPQVAIARDVTDPLNLKCNVYQDLEGIVLPVKKKRKRKRNDSGCFDDEQENKNKKESNNLNKEDVVSPKIKKKKVQKHGKDGKEFKFREKKKNIKEKTEEKKLENTGGNTIEHIGETLPEEEAVIEGITSVDKSEINLKDEKLSSEVEEKCSEVRPKPTASLITKELPKPKTETTNAQKPGQGTSKRKHQKAFVYGNYNHYYGYRNPKVPNDPRLKLFHREWFQDKTVLDIGCNIGNITLEVARDFSPKHALGIDIDSSLIRAANKYLRCAIQENISKTPKLSSDFPMSFMMCHGPIVSQTSPTEGRTGYPYNVQFKEENFVLQHDKALAKQKETYDVILCLSLTKWIHLNWGDEGLKRAFQRMFLMLNPGGRLLLEAQPFNSYSRRKNLSGKIRKNYDSIVFKPNQFVDYLMSEEVGFASYEALGVAENTSRGFQRPVYVFTKSVSGESYDALGVNIAENRKKSQFENSRH